MKQPSAKEIVPAAENKRQAYDLWNVQQERIEGTERMTPRQALDRNQALREDGAEQRWVPNFDEELEEGNR